METDIQGTTEFTESGSDEEDDSKEPELSQNRAHDSAMSSQDPTALLTSELERDSTLESWTPYK